MKQSIFLLIFILFISCDNKSQLQSNSDFDIDKIQLNDNCFDEIKTELIDSIRILKLNENEESFFVAISKLLVHNDTLYVFDRFGRDLLVSFDRNGNYITTFSQKGGGPKEYVQLWDFDVDSNYVYLYDRATKKMLYYDHSGNFIKSHSSSFRGDAFVVLQNNEFLFSLAKENKSPKVCITDSTLTITKTMLSYQKEELDDRITDNLFQRVKNIIYYNKVVNDSVYAFSNRGNMQKCYYFNFNNRNVPNNEKYSYDKLCSSKGKEKYIYLNDCPLILNNFIIGSVFQNGNKGTFLYDIRKGKGGIKEWRADKIELSDIILPITVAQNCVVGWIDYSVYEALSDKSMFSSELIQNLNDGGHILVFYYLNDAKNNCIH